LASLIGSFGGRRRRRGVEFDFRPVSISSNAGVDVEVQGDKKAVGLILIEDFDPLEIVFMIEEMDAFFDQLGGSFVDLSEKGDGSIAVAFSTGSRAEEIGEVVGSGA